MSIDVRAIRLATGLTQQAFADAYRLPIGSVRDWEQGRSSPDSGSLIYLKMIRADAAGVAAILAQID